MRTKSVVTYDNNIGDKSYTCMKKKIYIMYETPEVGESNFYLRKILAISLTKCNKSALDESPQPLLKESSCANKVKLLTI